MSKVMHGVVKAEMWELKKEIKMKDFTIVAATLAVGNRQKHNNFLLPVYIEAHFSLQNKDFITSIYTRWSNL